jgi:hypothetical protein
MSRRRRRGPPCLCARSRAERAAGPLIHCAPPAVPRRRLPSRCTSAAIAHTGTRIHRDTTRTPRSC